MPSPVGHTLSVFLALPLLPRINWQQKNSLFFLLASIVIANGPDIDFIAGFLAGAPNRFHHQLTHSFFFALIMAVFFTIYFRDRLRGKSAVSGTRLFLYFTFLAVLHPILDFFCADTSAPFGLMLLWPFSNEYFISSFALFSDIKRSSDMSSFIPSLFSHHNFLTLLQEIAVLAGFCLVSWWGAKRMNL